jgi:hypothetical protein
MKEIAEVANTVTAFVGRNEALTEAPGGICCAVVDSVVPVVPAQSTYSGTVLVEGFWIYAPCTIEPAANSV